MMSLLCGIVATSRSSFAQNPRAEIENGNVILRENGVTTSLTKDGKDLDVTLAPDQSTLVFVHHVDEIRTPGAQVVVRNQLWIAKRSEHWMPKTLLAGPIIERSVKLQEFRYAQFSPDGKLIYFLVLDYATVSPGLFWIGEDGATHFIAQAQKFWIIDEGVWSGNVIAQQNRTTLEGGRLEMYYMYDPAGKEVGLFGIYEQGVLNFLKEFSPGRYQREGVGGNRPQ